MYSASRLSDFIRLIGLETCKNREISPLRFPVLEIISQLICVVRKYGELFLVQIGGNDLRGEQVVIKLMIGFVLQFKVLRLSRKQIVKLFKDLLSTTVTCCQKIKLSWLLKYREFLPNATFGPGKKSHQPNFALAKYSQ